MRRGEKKKRRMSEEKERGEENENRGSGKRCYKSNVLLINRKNRSYNKSVNQI